MTFLVEASSCIKFRNLPFPLLDFLADDLRTSWCHLPQEVPFFRLQTASYWEPLFIIHISSPQIRLDLAARKASCLHAAWETSRPSQLSAYHLHPWIASFSLLFLPFLFPFTTSFSWSPDFFPFLFLHSFPWRLNRNSQISKYLWPMNLKLTFRIPQGWTSCPSPHPSFLFLVKPRPHTDLLFSV